MKVDTVSVTEIRAYHYGGEEVRACVVCGVQATYLMEFLVENDPRGDVIHSAVCRAHYESATRDVERLVGSPILPQESLN